MKFQSNYQALAHHWIYNNDHSECYGNRMFSENDSIYSYVRHYEIARKLRNKKGDLIGYALNSNDNTVTTNKQRYIVERSLNHRTVIHIDPKNIENPLKVIRYFMTEIASYEPLIKSARSKKDDYIVEQANLFQNLQEYLNIIPQMGIKFDKRKLSKVEKDFLNTSVDDLLGMDLTTTLFDLRLAKSKKEEKVRRKALELQLADEKVKLDRWLNHETNQLYLRHTTKVYLRLKGDRIETSQGASVGVSEALNFFNLLTNNPEKVIGFKFENGYIVKELTDNIVTIGCHKIEIAQFQNIFNQLQTVAA